MSCAIRLGAIKNAVGIADLDESVRAHALDIVVPELDGEIVGDELPLA